MNKETVWMRAYKTNKSSVKIRIHGYRLKTNQYNDEIFVVAREVAIKTMG